jgi:hypothetical protein
MPAAVLAAGAVLTVLLSPGPQPDNSDPSSWATGAAGTWALYHLAEKLGASPSRLTGSSFAADLRPPAILVEAAPSTPFDPSQVRAVLHFVQAGGTLVFALDRNAVDEPLLASLRISPGATVGSGPWRTLLPIDGPTDLLVRSARAPSLTSRAASAIPLLGTVSRPVALLERVGRGRALVFDSEAVLSNSLLDRDGNAQFASAMLGLGPGARVIFDEIHHGYSLGDGAEALLLGTPLGLVTALCSLLLLLFLFSSGRRLGRPLPPPELVAVRSTEDHLEAVARLYARAGDRRAVAGHYLRQLRARPAAGGPPAGTMAPDSAPAVTALISALERATEEPVSLAELRRLARSAHSLEMQGLGRSQEEDS